MGYQPINLIEDRLHQYFALRSGLCKEIQTFCSLRVKYSSLQSLQQRMEISIELDFLGLIERCVRLLMTLWRTGGLEEGKLGLFTDS